MIYNLLKTILTDYNLLFIILVFSLLTYRLGFLDTVIGFTTVIFFAFFVFLITTVFEYLFFKYENGKKAKKITKHLGDRKEQF